MKKEQLNTELMAAASVLKRFKALEFSNRSLKDEYAKTELEKTLLKTVVSHKFMSSDARRSLVTQAIKKYGLSVRQACQLFNLSRTAYYYESNKPDTDEAEKRLMELSSLYPYFGYWKYYSILRNEGYVINHKRVYRIYKESIRPKTTAISN